MPIKMFNTYYVKNAKTQLELHGISTPDWFNERAGDWEGLYMALFPDADEIDLEEDYSALYRRSVGKSFDQSAILTPELSGAEQRYKARFGSLVDPELASNVLAVTKEAAQKTALKTEADTNSESDSDTNICARWSKEEILLALGFPQDLVHGLQISDTDVLAIARRELKSRGADLNSKIDNLVVAYKAFIAMQGAFSRGKAVQRANFRRKLASFM